MKRTSIIALGCLLASALFIQASPLTATVYDFTGEGDEAALGNKVSALLTADLSQITNLVMIERADLGKVLSEQAFSVSGMVSSDAAAKIGQITGAKVLIAGQVMKTNGRLLVVADVIGTETGRLFAVKETDDLDNLDPLCEKLARAVMQTITAQTANLVSPPVETHEQCVARIVKSVTGTNRPAISININAYNGHGQNWRDDTTEGELGAVLIKAGFALLDNDSEKKSDIQIVGSSATETGLPRGGLLTGRAMVDVKIQLRRTGEILAVEHEEATAADLGDTVAGNAAKVRAADVLMERIAPLLSK